MAEKNIRIKAQVGSCEGDAELENILEREVMLGCCCPRFQVLCSCVSVSVCLRSCASVFKRVPAHHHVLLSQWSESLTGQRTRVASTSGACN